MSSSPVPRQRSGPIDILVNNAAMGGYVPFDETSPKSLERCLQVNLWAPWELMTSVVAGMRERRRGWILNLTTFSAELPPGPPFPTNRPAKAGFQYGASKAALNRLTVAAASECEGQGIAVNALTPQAAISTPNLVAVGGIDDAMFEPLETMAEAALALCSGDPGVLTGRIAFSLQLLLELHRPVLDLQGEQLVAGWQPASCGRSSNARRPTSLGAAGLTRTRSGASTARAPDGQALRLRAALRGAAGLSATRLRGALLVALRGAAAMSPMSPAAPA